VKQQQRWLQALLLLLLLLLVVGEAGGCTHKTSWWGVPSLPAGGDAKKKRKQ
jgi:hypothetical protein